MDVIQIADCFSVLSINENEAPLAGRQAKVSDCIVPLKFPSTDPFEIPDLEGRSFVRQREVQLEILMNMYCSMVFDGLRVRSVTWNKRLNSTAGLTKLMTEGSKRTATIELATKVIGKR